MGRLISAAGAGGNWNYSYDTNGNRTETGVNGAFRAWFPASDSNRLLAVADPPRAFTHDAAGNTTTDWQMQSSWVAGYNLAGRLATLVRSTRDGQLAANTVQLTYMHNASGQRVARHRTVVSACGPAMATCSIAGQALDSVIFVYGQQGQLLGEYRASDGAVLREYVWLGQIPVAVIAPNAVLPGATTDVFHIRADHLGTPRVVLDTAGRQRWTWLSGEPFGVTGANTNPGGLGVFTFNLRFPGQYIDQDSGLVYNHFRDFDPSLGRYVQSDPIGLAGGLNTYAYAESQPTSLIDPLGLATFMCRAPLHAVTGALGDGRATWAMSNVPMAHHRYLCVPGQCGGLDQRGEKWSDPLWSPGKPSKGEFDAERCEQKEPDDTCIESCVVRRLNGPRPTYGIPLGTDCQEWAEEVLNSCRYECSSNTPNDRPYIGYPSSGRRGKR